MAAPEGRRGQCMGSDRLRPLRRVPRDLGAEVVVGTSRACGEHKAAEARDMRGPGYRCSRRSSKGDSRSGMARKRGARPGTSVLNGDIGDVVRKLRFGAGTYGQLRPRWGAASGSDSMHDFRMRTVHRGRRVHQPL